MNRREVGLIASDQCTHVVMPRLAGPRAACNDEPITRRIPGWFDPTDPLACVECVKATANDA